MKLLGREDLRLLLDSPEDISVSVYLPTSRTGDVAQGAIRLKNLLRKAEENLLVMGLRPAEAAQLLDRCRGLVDDTLFWHHQADGLAIFLSAGTFTYFRLPYALDETVVVANRFHVNPLLPLFTADGIFYVLALSQNSVRLMQCSRDGGREVTLDGLPGSMADVLQYEEHSRNLQFHSGPSQGAAGRGNAMYHGHGEGKDTAKDDIVRFVREVDHGLQAALKDEQAPLVLAGVGFMRALYREGSTYAHLLDEGVDGSPDALSPAELQSKSWPLVERHFAQERVAALAQFGQGVARGLTVNGLTDVLLAAHDGRAAVLFFVIGSRRWGRFFAEERRIELHDSFEPGDEDLVDVAVVRALLTGAAVHAIPPGEMPNGKEIAASLRY